MLIADISQSLTAETTAGAVAKHFADRLVADPAVLRSELYGEGPLSRKRFCELFGVGESTLTGWLQTERIPQSAAVAYVLFLLSTRLLEQLQKNEAAQEQPSVVALHDGYAVVTPAKGEDGQQLGKLVASGISDLTAARRIAFAQSNDFEKILGRQIELVDDLISLTAEAGNDTPYRMAELGKERSALDRLQLLIRKVDREAREGKARSKSTATAARGGS